MTTMGRKLRYLTRGTGVRRTIASAALITMCLGEFAEAHPHVFVDAKTGFIVDDTHLLQGLRISWTYDEFASLILFETLRLDQDNDGVLNDAERAAIIEGETVWAPEYKGDTYLEVAGSDYPLGRPNAAAVAFENNQVTVSFDLPLATPVEIKNTAATLRLYDPIFYYAYTILPDQLGTALPEACQAKVVTFEPNAAETALQDQLAALSREETPEQPEIGRLFADQVQLTCG